MHKFLTCSAMIVLSLACFIPDAAAQRRPAGGRPAAHRGGVPHRRPVAARRSLRKSLPAHRVHRPTKGSTGKIRTRGHSGRHRGHSRRHHGSRHHRHHRHHHHHRHWHHRHASIAGHSGLIGGRMDNSSDGPSAAVRAEGAGDDDADYPSLSAVSMRSRDRLPDGAEDEDEDDEDADEPALNWPLGLRILPPGPQTQELRSEVDTLMKLALRQAATGKVRRQLVSRIQRDLAKLGLLLNERSATMRVSEYTIQESRQFLKELNDLVGSL